MKTFVFSYEKKYIWREIYIGIVFLVIASIVFVMHIDIGTPSAPLLVYFTAVYGTGGYGCYKFVRGLMRLLKSSQALVISNEGIRDTGAGNIQVPWGAIREFKNVRLGNFGNTLVMMTDPSMLPSIPGPLHVRVGLWLAGARAGRPANGKLLPVMLTPPMVLADATIEDFLTAIRAHKASSDIPINTVE